MTELAIEEDCLALLILLSTSPLCRDTLTLACMTSTRAMWTESESDDLVVFISGGLSCSGILVRYFSEDGTYSFLKESLT